MLLANWSSHPAGKRHRGLPRALTYSCVEVFVRPVTLNSSTTRGVCLLGGSAVSAGVWTGTNPSERGWCPPSDTLKLRLAVLVSDQNGAR